MKHRIFTVFDVKAQAYLPPFCMPETAMAVRVFTDCVNADDHQFAKHPGDYTLFELGSWDDSCATIAAVAGSKVVNGLEVIFVEAARDREEARVAEDQLSLELVNGEDENETA